MENIFDVAEPPRLCPVDVPVLFDPRSNASVMPDGNPEGNPERREGGDVEGVYKELDACLSVLQGLKPEVRGVSEWDRGHPLILLLLLIVILVFSLPTLSNFRFMHISDILSNPTGHDLDRSRQI